MGARGAGLFRRHSQPPAMKTKGRSQMNDQGTETHNEGEWGPDAVADIIATLAVLTVLVAGAVVFVAGA